MALTFYPETHYILAMTTVRRDRKLPDDAAAGEVLVTERQRVEPSTTLLRGTRAGHFRVVPIKTAALGVRRLSDIKPEWIIVQEGTLVRAGEPLIQRGQGRGARKFSVPFSSVVARIEADRFILQETPETVEVRALYTGIVSALRSRREVQIEAVGALVQGVWGNGRDTFGTVAEAPEAGLQSLASEEILTTYRGQILLTRLPLTAQTLAVVERQQVAGVIAPAMPAELIPQVLAMNAPVLLTEGFGEHKMSDIVYNLLRDNDGRQVALDAVEPKRFSAQRPELFIPLPGGVSLPPLPERGQGLFPGVQVRIARAPNAGQAGRVVRVFETPQVLETGLRVSGAEIQLGSGKLVFVPIDNLESLGRALDRRR